MTVVFALPLGYFLTSQHVGRTEVLGAAVIVAGLAMFTIFADPAGGVDDAPASDWAVLLVLLCGLAVVLMFLGGRGSLTRKAATYGLAAGVLFGLSASLAKPTVETLHEVIGEVLTDWEAYAMAITGIAAFVVQQVSLGTGKLAPSVATVSVANPVAAITIGALVLAERLARPVWHIVLGVGGLLLALGGGRGHLARHGERQDRRGADGAFARRASSDLAVASAAPTAPSTATLTGERSGAPEAH